MPTPRADAVAVAGWDGRIYVVGGSAGSGTALATVEVYDPATDEWSPRAPLPMAAVYPMAAVGLPDGGLYVFADREAWRFDVLADTWETQGSLPMQVEDAVLLPDDSVAAVDLSGGLWRYDYITATWDGPYPGRIWRQFASLAVDAEGRILVGGGQVTGAGAIDPGTFFNLPLVDRFDPETGVWDALAPPESVSLGSLHIVDEQLYWIGDTAGLSPELVVQNFTEG